MWIVSLDSGETTVLSGLYVWDDGWGFPDMEWSPDGAELAIANGLIRLYSTVTGESRSLDGSTGAQALTWSPDGTRIAYERSNEIWIADVDGTGAIC